MIQVKNHKVMRVIPFENESVNECWIADRDRFSYEALNGPERLTQPMLKQGGQWKSVDWQTALEYVANGLADIKNQHGAASIGVLASPHSSVEELHLAAALIRGLGADNIDHRLRRSEFAATSVQWLGRSIASLSTLNRLLVVGSNLRKDHPLFAQRIRQAVKRGAKVHAIAEQAQDWAMPVASMLAVPSAMWVSALAKIASSIARSLDVAQKTADKYREALTRLTA